MEGMAEKNISKNSLYPDLPTHEPHIATLYNEPLTATNSNPPNKNNTPPITQNNPSSTPPDYNSLYPSLEDDIKPSPIRKHYTTFLQEYIEKIEEIIDKLKEIRTRAENYHYKNNVAKLSGTVVGTTGVALVVGSLAWAPVTAGSSLILGAGGAVMSVTGSLTNVITDYVDYKTTEIIMEDIKTLSKEKEMFDVWMQKSLSHFNECIDQLVSEGVSRDVAISTIIEGIAKGAINILEKPTNAVLTTLSTAAKLHHLEHIAIGTLPVLGKTFHITEKSFQFVYNVLGLTGRTIPTLMKDFAKISGILSMAFVVADISLLIKDLSSEHPSVEIIDKGLKQLEDEKNILEDLLDIIVAAGGCKEHVLEKALKDMGMIEDEELLLKDFVVINDEEFHEKAGINAQ